MTVVRKFTTYFNEMNPKVRLQIGVSLAAVLAIALLYSFAFDRVKGMERLRSAREAEIAELMVLKQRYREASSVAQRVANLQATVRPDDSPAKLVEDIGIKGKGLQVKPLKSDERDGFIEEVAEVKIDSITVNEAINLLYRLEYGNKPVTVRRALLKTRFEDPSRLDLSLTVALRKGAVQK
jgi:general secretion pathway protein M